MEEKCFDCKVSLREVKTKYKGIEFTVLKCPKCKKEVFNLELAHKVAIEMKQQRLKQEYTRKVIKVGHSLGITFPKDVAEALELDNPKTKLEIIPNLAKRKIELILV